MRLKLMLLFLRSLLFYSGLAIVTILYTFLIVLLFLAPFEWRYRFILTWAPLMLRWLSFTCGLNFQVTGQENIPNEPCVVMSKHQSAWETIGLQVIFPRLVWVLKRELLWIPFFGWSLACTRPIAIDRKAGRKALMQVIEQGIKRLQEGFHVVIFPEGTRVAPNERKRYGLGGANLAIQANRLVIPVAHNAGLFWRRNEFAKRAGTVQIIIGEPIDSRGKTAQELTDLVEQWIESQMPKLNN